MHQIFLYFCLRPQLVIVLIKGGCEGCAPLLVSLLTNKPSWHQLPPSPVTSPLTTLRENRCHFLPTACPTQWGVAPGSCSRHVSFPIHELFLKIDFIEIQWHFGFFPSLWGTGLNWVLLTLGGSCNCHLKVDGAGETLQTFHSFLAPDLGRSKIWEQIHWALYSHRFM